MNLEALGWNDHFSAAFNALSEPLWIPARVLSVDRSTYSLGGDFGEVTAKISGRYSYSATNSSEMPAVGDWVAIDFSNKDDIAIIHELLPRVTCIARKAAGEVTEMQIIAANVDSVVIITGLDNNFNLRRIERYIALIRNTGAQPVVVLNKADLVESASELDEIRLSIEAIAFDVPVHFISVINDQGLSDLLPYFTRGKTVTLLGSSGVGKSTLTNYFLGSEQQRVVETRADDSRGRHTTTRRQLFLLPSGGMLIDTPGMRELQLWMDDKKFDIGFCDIDTIKESCRFTDCTHNHEPGCAVQEAIGRGDLDVDRLTSYNKMKKELKYLEKRQQETGWDLRLEDRKFGKFRHTVLKHRKNNPH